VTGIEADYLLVGAGAMGMAFVDTLLAETDANIVLVDENHQPGGGARVATPTPSPTWIARRSACRQRRLYRCSTATG
jgi:glycine/D-amino acid oxidase-like deaminating enzyme